MEETGEGEKYILLFSLRVCEYSVKSEHRAECMAVSEWFVFLIMCESVSRFDASLLMLQARLSCEDLSIVCLAWSVRWNKTCTCLILDSLKFLANLIKFLERSQMHVDLDLDSRWWHDKTGQVWVDGCLGLSSRNNQLDRHFVGVGRAHPWAGPAHPFATQPV